jgi:predicted outer membrane lipoprotein
VKIFGREPVVIATLLASALQLINALWLHWDNEQTAAINAAIAVVLGAVAAALVSVDKLLPLLAGVAQALITVGAVFGYHLSADATAGLMALISALIAFLGVRPHVSAKVPPLESR